MQASTQDLQLAYLRELTDLREPHKWFPGARKMKRKWILHVGPTNSGSPPPPAPSHANPAGRFTRGTPNPEP